SATILTFMETDSNGCGLLLEVVYERQPQFVGVALACRNGREHVILTETCIFHFPDQILPQRVGDAKIDFPSVVDASKVGLEVMELGQPFRLHNRAANREITIADALRRGGQELVRPTLEQMVRSERSL